MIKSERYAIHARDRLASGQRQDACGEFRSAAAACHPSGCVASSVVSPVVPLDCSFICTLPPKGYRFTV